MGEVELSLVGLEDERGEGEAEVGGNLPLQVDAARGVVYGKGGRGEEETSWHLQMSAPITSLWVQDGSRLIQVNLSSHSALPNHQRPTLMMGEPPSTSCLFSPICVWLSHKASHAYKNFHYNVFVYEN